MNQVRLLSVNIQFLNRNLNPSGMSVKRIKIDHNENAVRKVLSHLSVEKEIFIVHLVEIEIPRGLEGNIFSPRFIYPGN